LPAFFYVSLMMKNYKTYWLQRSIAYNFLLFAVLMVTASCSKKNYASLGNYNFNAAGNKPDYSNLNYWAAHPWKKDPGDSIPKPLQKNFVKDSTVDVFFLHPTTLTDKTNPNWNADINDAAINSKTDYTSILYQASVFNQSCRVFAPRYRQAHIKAFYINNDTATAAFEMAYADIKTAFEFYLQHYNSGRPIIIASHSQGTKHAGRLLKEFFDGKVLQNKLVCAYIIGLPVPQNYFTSLPPCNNAGSTGCIISWRTYKSGYTEPSFVARETFKATVINPLTWTNDTLPINNTQNKGGVLLNFNKVVPNVVSAQIHGNVLWSSKPNVPGKIFFTKKNYHAGDINLFYINIRENVRERIEAFWKR
jgi:Protein of unknown function (DUF3089)